MFHACTVLSAIVFDIVFTKRILFIVIATGQIRDQIKFNNISSGLLGGIKSPMGDKKPDL